MIQAGPLPVPADLADQVDPVDYGRLLGYPDGRPPSDRALDLAVRSRAWYAAQGRPWAAVRQLGIEEIAGDRLRLEDGSELLSRALADRLAGAKGLIAAAVSAGPEVDAASGALWPERPDAAYCLDRFGAAVAEHLAAWTGRQLRATAHGGELAVLPSYSPGYPDWPLEQQVTLAACLTRQGRMQLPGRFDVLESGMIDPKNSLLAVFGLTADRAAAETAWRRQRCSWCSLARCAFRRTRRGSYEGSSDER